MADQRFFDRRGPFKLSDLATKADLQLPDSADGDCIIKDIASLDAAAEGTLSFFINKKYRSQLAETKAQAVIVSASECANVPTGTIALVAEDPHLAYAIVAQQFYPETPDSFGTDEAQISPHAHIDPSAELGANVQVAHGAVIGRKVQIADNASIGANSCIADGVVLGEGCKIGANVSLSHSLLGKRVTILPGARIGQRGFGFAMTSQGHEKVPQTGRVIIEDDCEIGANTCIDRGAGPDTIIGTGTMIDNLVQIAHNVQIGKHCVIAAGVGIAGSTKLGDFVIMAGKSAAAGHINLASGTTVLGNAGVISDTSTGDKLIGTPAIDSRTYFKIQAKLLQMVKARRKGQVNRP